MIVLSSTLVSELLRRTFTSHPRRKRFYTKRVLLVAAGGAVTFASIFLSIKAGTSATGLYLFRYSTVGALIAVTLLTAFAGGAVFVEERKARTLSLLVITEATSWELLLVKLWTLLFQSTLTALSLLPMFLILTGLGGVTVPQILLAYAIILCAAFLSSALGLMISAIVKSQRAMLVYVSAALLTVFILVPLALTPMLSIAIPYQIAASILSPFSATAYAMDYQTIHFAPWGCLSCLALGSLFMKLAHMFLSRNSFKSDWIHSRRDDDPRHDLKASDAVRHKPLPALKSNPILWRDVNVVYRRKGLRHPVFQIVFFVLALHAPLLCLLLASWTRTGVGAGDMLLFLSIIPATLFFFGTMLYGSLCLNMEKKQRIIDLLLLSGTSMHVIVAAKLSAIYRHLFPYILCAFAGLTVSSILRCSMPPVVLGFIVFDYLSMCLAYPILALSLVVKVQTQTALRISSAVLIVWFVVGRALVGLVLFNGAAAILGFGLDFAFHIWLILIGSVIVENAIDKHGEST